MFTGVLFVVHNSLIFESGNADTLFFVGGSENNCPVSGVQVPDANPPKKSFFTHSTTYANKKDIRPKKPDFIGLFWFYRHVRERHEP